MRKKLLIVLFLTVVLVACKNENNYIIPTDFSLFMPDSAQISNGITEKQQQKRTGEFLKAIRKNTLNHVIPNITVCDLKGQSQNLKEQLINTKLIIASRLTCAWDMDGVLNDFPKANQLIENPIDKSEIVLLILREKNDYFNQQYEDNLYEIKRNYSKIFIIDSLQSTELNIFGFTRYYISEEHIVLDIGNGTYLSDDYMRFELEKNTVAKNK